MPMKNWLSKLLIAALLLLPGGTIWAQTKIATVDLRKLFDNYWKTKQAEGALKDLEAELKKELGSLRESHKKMTEDYQKLLADANDQAVSSEEREKRKKIAEGKLRDIKESEDTIKSYVTNADERLLMQRRRMREDILGQIRTMINAKAKAGNFALVVDTTAETPNATPIVIYTNGENDLTSSVLAELNAGAPVEVPKPGEKPDDDKKGKK
jgi:Skp family chaperone for outer membrane proteins